jgi:uncharacterized protein YacL (UPF0231 family)
MWNREGQHITGHYLNAYLVSGKVLNSRVKYGGTVSHTVQLDRAITLFGTERSMVTLDEEEVMIPYNQVAA